MILLRSGLFSDSVGLDGSGSMSLESPRLLSVKLDGELLARQGATVDHRGAIEFTCLRAGGLRHFFQRSTSGEAVPLMRCTGRGQLFLAQRAHDLYLVELQGDSLAVNAANVLAFDPQLAWEIRCDEDVATMVFAGNGGIALSSIRTPIVLDAAQASALDAAGSAIAWSSSGFVIV